VAVQGILQRLSGAKHTVEFDRFMASDVITPVTHHIRF
jgi:hypothetical protein